MFTSRGSRVVLAAFIGFGLAIASSTGTTEAADKPGALKQRPATTVSKSTVKPARVTRGVAPWQRVPAAKQRYSVYRELAPTQLRKQIDKPMADPKYAKFLAKRARAFRSGKRRLPLVLQPASTVDIGAPTPVGTRTAALVDLTKSKKLEANIVKSLKVDLSKTYVNAVLVSGLSPDAKMSRKRKRNTYQYSDTLIVSVANKDHTRAASWLLKNGKWVKLYDVRGKAMAKSIALKKRAKLKSASSKLYYGNYGRVSLDKRIAGERYFEKANAATKQGAAKFFTDTSSDSLMAAFLKLQVQDPNNDPSTHQSLQDAASALAKQAQEEAAANKESKPAWGPLGGSAFLCHDYCSPGQCMACCFTLYFAELATIGTIAGTCHALSDLCPWCHAGCAIATAAMTSAATAQFTLCTANCVHSYTPSGPVCGTG